MWTTVSLCLPPGAEDAVETRWDHLSDTLWKVSCAIQMPDISSQIKSLVPFLVGTKNWMRFEKMELWEVKIWQTPQGMSLDFEALTQTVDKLLYRLINTKYIHLQLYVCICVLHTDTLGRCVGRTTLWGSFCNNLGLYICKYRKPYANMMWIIRLWWPGEFHGPYSPWGHKELDTTERLSLFHFTAIIWLLRWHSGKNLPANAGDVRDVGLIPGSGRSPGVGNGNPLQYSCLENPMDREGQWATVYGTAKSWTCLSMHLYIYLFFFFFLTIITLSPVQTPEF